MERYVNPYTDFGFKKLFGTEMSKEVLISFLNALLHDEQHIVDLTYLNNEHLGSLDIDRRAVFDVYCENDRGQKFIVEMQKAGQKFFKDRSVFYSTFPIREQAQQGSWNYELKAVYTIGILNFVFDEDKDDKEFYHHEVKLMDTERKTVFYDKLTFIYLEMPKFNKTETELVTMFDKWMFVLKNLVMLMERPAALQERVFEHFFRIAEIARFTPSEIVQYEASLKNYRDWYSITKTAIEKAQEEGMQKGIKKGIKEGIKEGMQKGIEEGMQEGEKKKQREIALNLKKLNTPITIIAQATGLSIQEIEIL